MSYELYELYELYASCAPCEHRRAQGGWEVGVLEYRVPPVVYRGGCPLCMQLCFCVLFPYPVIHAFNLKTSHIQLKLGSLIGKKIEQLPVKPSCIYCAKERQNGFLYIHLTTVRGFSAQDNTTDGSWDMHIRCLVITFTAAQEPKELELSAFEKIDLL